MAGLQLASGAQDLPLARPGAGTGGLSDLGVGEPQHLQSQELALSLSQPSQPSSGIVALKHHGQRVGRVARGLKPLRLTVIAAPGLKQHLALTAALPRLPGGGDHQPLDHPVTLNVDLFVAQQPLPRGLTSILHVAAGLTGHETLDLRGVFGVQGRDQLLTAGGRSPR